MVSVMRLAAMGAITLQRMLYLRPSLARVSVKPTWASLAAGVKLSAQGSVSGQEIHDKDLPE